MSRVQILEDDGKLGGREIYAFDASLTYADGRATLCGAEDDMTGLAQAFGEGDVAFQVVLESSLVLIGCKVPSDRVAGTKRRACIEFEYASVVHRSTD